MLYTRTPPRSLLGVCAKQQSTGAFFEAVTPKTSTTLASYHRSRGKGTAKPTMIFPHLTWCGLLPTSVYFGCWDGLHCPLSAVRVRPALRVIKSHVSPFYLPYVLPTNAPGNRESGATMGGRVPERRTTTRVLWLVIAFWAADVTITNRTLDDGHARYVWRGQIYSLNVRGEFKLACPQRPTNAPLNDGIKVNPEVTAPP